MNRLVPFPTGVASLPDAELLDLNVVVTADPVHGRSAASTEARGRYATGARVSQVRSFYLEQFEQLGAVINTSGAHGNGTNAVIRATLRDELATQYSVVVDALAGYRAVKVTARYAGFDARTAFATFARWHNGVAPVEEQSEPTGFEISTFANGRAPGALVLYSTYYDCPQTSIAAQRALVDQRVEQLGWSYHEPREGIMFMHDGQFDAETHVMGDATSSNVTFVGEFALSPANRLNASG